MPAWLRQYFPTTNQTGPSFDPPTLFDCIKMESILFFYAIVSLANYGKKKAMVLKCLEDMVVIYFNMRNKEIIESSKFIWGTGGAYQ